MSFGRGPSNALLGSPLNYAVPVRLEAGESLAPECVGAEVQVGDRRLQAGDIRVRLEPGASPSERVIRVTSPVAVDEPVLTVTVLAGCSGRMSRRYTTLVDPPSSGVPSVAPPVVAELQPLSPALDAALASAPPAPAARSQADTGARSERVPPRPPREQAQRVTRAPRPLRPVAPPAVLPAAPDAVAAERAATAPLRRSVAARKAPPTAAAAPALPTGQARLRLEAADPLDFPPRRALVGAAAGSGAAAAAAAANLPPMLGDLLMASEAASAAAARVNALERSVQALQAESKTNRELMTQMRERIAANEFWARMAPWLGGALAVVSGLALMLGLGLRRSRAEQRQWWNQMSPEQAAAAAAQAKDSAAVPTMAAAAASVAVTAKPARPDMALPREPHLAPAPMAGVPPPTMPLAEPGPMDAGSGRVSQPLAFETQVLRDLPATDSGTQPRAVAIDELIDLEQQADFFIALGQDDSAVDLLVGHIRGSGGVSPMAYLKLLEIYRRKGDLDSYERTRNRFNHRFNAVAPEWGADLHAGRMLEEYPEVLRRLSAVWPDSLHTMAELEALMFRRDGGETFDLPAYRELLFLLALARDNLDAAGGGPDTDIDLLLPLGDPGELLTSPAPLSFDPLPVPAVAVLDAAEPAGFTLDAPASAPGGLDLNLASGPMPIHEPGGASVVRVVDTDLDLDLKLGDAPPPGPSRR